MSNEKIKQLIYRIIEDIDDEIILEAIYRFLQHFS